MNPMPTRGISSCEVAKYSLHDTVKKCNIYCRFYLVLYCFFLSNLTNRKIMLSCILYLDMFPNKKNNNKVNYLLLLTYCP